MHYLITVTLNGKHLFTTSDHTAPHVDKVHSLVALFRMKFPEDAGYKVLVVKVETTHKVVNVVLPGAS